MRQHLHHTSRGMIVLAIACATFSHSETTPEVAAQSPSRFENALAEYVHKKDPAYRYDLRQTISGSGFTEYIIELVSQNFLTLADVDRTEWRHWLVVVKPDVIRHKTALVYVGGGSNRDDAPRGARDEFVSIAVTTGSVVAELRMVPNQPLRFAGENKRRFEDGLIAYTWDKFYRTGDVRWPARMAMTKSVKAAMDALQEFIPDVSSGHTLSDFVVTGASKRGWTTWTIAAVDQRVRAIIPIVIDMLNLVPSFKHHWRAYGFWAPAIDDYVDQNIMAWMGSPEELALHKLVEPYTYRQRLTLPKLIINATGDEFFLPTSSKFYFDKLLGEKHLRYVPNSRHNLSRTDAMQTLLAYYHSVLNDRPRPRFEWSFEADGSIIVECDEPPVVATIWSAVNPTNRDFRVDSIGRSWTAEVLEPVKEGVYRAHVTTPESGWKAFLVELTYSTSIDVPMKLTTAVRVLPDTLPHNYIAPEWPDEGFIRSKQQ